MCNMVSPIQTGDKDMNASNSVSLKILVCAAASMALTLGFSWSFVESTSVAYGTTGGASHSLSAHHGAAPLSAPFAAVVAGRSATLLG
jgi:hypothetical protein